MDDRVRLEQLHVLLGRLDVMPPSSERDWMLREVRSRAVDVETGNKTAAVRAMPADEPDATAPRATLAPARLKPVVRRPAVRPVIARPASPVSPASLVVARQQLQHEGTVDLLQSGGEICLDDTPATVGTSSRPWSGGLRG